MDVVGTLDSKYKTNRDDPYELVFCSPPCQAWLYTDSGGEEKACATPSYRLFEVIAHSNDVRAEVIVVENSIRSVCGGVEKLNKLMLAMERAGWRCAGGRARAGLGGGGGGGGGAPTGAIDGH